jgi:PKD repeat protein
LVEILLAAVAALAMVVTGFGPVTTLRPAQAESPAIDPALRTGLSLDTAAASCWEIKQLHPASADGPYWLLTPSMTAPQQFWCDMTTDGGGWVRIGSGREQWSTAYDGKGSASELLLATPPLTRAVQLGSSTVDALLDGRRVDDLQDRVRIRRAANADGSSWQEVRYQYVNRDRWVWTMGAEHRVSTWSFGTLNGTGGQTTSFGSLQGLNRLNGTIQENQGFRWGYAYGTQVTGTNSASTYLWASTNGGGSALPYAEVYLRPRLMSLDLSFPRVPDSGTTTIENRPVANSAALVNPWGVNGTAGSTGTEGNVEVQALEQIGNVMYVGGNFRWVQRDAAGTGRVEQSFLAAFNATTGEFIPGFAPRFNEQVRALAALPNGTLAVGGDFTQANGQAVQGLVAVNATSGASVSSWQVRLENNVSPGVVRIRSMDVGGDQLYLAGNFTHLSRPDGTGRVYARNAGRVSVTNGVPNNWNPELNGTVNDVATSEDGSRAYFAGFFDRSRQDTAFRAAAVLTQADAALDPVTWSPVWSNTNKNYQRAVDQAGDRVWVGGSEHSLFDFSSSTYQRLGGSITKRGGDFQAIEVEDGLLYAGCHCNQWNYQDAYTWSNVGTGWNQADAIGWIGLWDATTGRYVPDFTPEFSTRLGSAIWAIEIADDGTVWAGGDITTGRTTSGARWLGGFARWAPRDTTAPGQPSNFRIVSQTGSSVTLAWNSAGAGTSGYQVLRDDRTVGTTNGALNLTVPKGGENRFFVRAVDPAGNASASTSVLATGDGNPAPVPVIVYEANGLDVRFDATGSSDDGTIESYLWDLGDGTASTDPVVEHAYATTGTYTVRLTVVDDLGAFRTAAEEVDITLSAPTDAYGTTVLEDDPFLWWRLEETSGSLTQDRSGNDRPGVYHGTVTRGIEGALVDNLNLAAGFDGSSAHVVGAPGTQVTNPGPFSVEVWFRSTSTRGGKLIGLGNAASGLSSSYDRHVYLRDDGRLTFGVWTGAQNTAISPQSYNDGAWHHVVATQGPAGMSLYVDGELVATNPQTQAQNYTGYWRVGGDRVWDGASSPYLAGALDEAAIYTAAMSAERVLAHYLAGRQELPPNQSPTAAFSVTDTGLSITVDGSASADPDGEIVSYAWAFGDGAMADGATATHTYSSAGTFTVELTVVDDLGASHSVTQAVTVEPLGDPVTATVVERDASWSWYYAEAAPSVTWKQVGTDLSTWQVGPAPLGFGFDAATDIDIDGPTSDRPRAAYFVREFQVADADRVVSLVLDTIADDGVMVHVNGVEVGRHNMHEGEITHTTFAPTARRRSVALNDPVVIDVPVELLVDGTNVVAAQTHLNYRNTPDLSFELDAVMTTR